VLRGVFLRRTIPASEKTYGSHHVRIFAEIARHAKFGDFSMDFDHILSQKDPGTIKKRTFSSPCDEEQKAWCGSVGWS
jgi:hypothetical protein